MTEACRAFVTHAFDTLKLNRVVIECASKNVRSRGVPDRLGFSLEGVLRGVEWLHDHYADHAIYGLLKGEMTRVEKVRIEEVPHLAMVAA
jgi:ribosomal-protein-serine acetyltransferase